MIITVKYAIPKFSKCKILVHLIKAIHMVATESVEPTEITIMILSVIILSMHCAYNDTQRSHGIINTLHTTILTAVLETIRDLYIVWNDGRDGYGCPFV